MIHFDSRRRSCSSARAPPAIGPGARPARALRSPETELRPLPALARRTKPPKRRRIPLHSSHGHAPDSRVGGLSAPCPGDGLHRPTCHRRQLEEFTISADRLDVECQQPGCNSLRYPLRSRQAPLRPSPPRTRPPVPRRPRRFPPRLRPGNTDRERPSRAPVADRRAPGLNCTPGNAFLLTRQRCCGRSHGRRIPSLPPRRR